MISVRKFKELGAVEDKELPELEPIEQSPMQLGSAEVGKGEAEEGEEK